MPEQFQVSKTISGFALFIIMCAISGLCGFVQYKPDVQSKSLYSDDFEGYVTTKLVRQAYTAWEDGAHLEINLEPNIVGDGSQALRIDVLGPNPLDNVTSGSIYHSLPLTNRDWSNTSGIRFWISNPSKENLWLTFNFKEAYNEYWSVDSGAPFLLEGSDASIQQENCQYGNLVIPPEFTGRVIIPISSFAVPDWNTARGDKRLQLSAIESYAIGLTVHRDYPRTFYIDSFEVLSPDEIIPVIRGVQQIEIPPSGEHLEPYQIINVTTGSTLPAAWKVKSPDNPGLIVTDNGNLTIPSTTYAGMARLYANSTNTDGGILTSLRVRLSGGAFPVQETQSDNVIPAPTKTAYEKFAADFEKWAMDYRPLFVILSVSLVVICIYFLSRFQNRLK